MDAELTKEQKEKIEAESQRRLSFIQMEYWRLRNGRQQYMRCPYCRGAKRKGMRKNFEGGAMCCNLFAKAFKAILDRQDQVDRAAQAARTIHAIGQMAGGRPN